LAYLSCPKGRECVQQLDHGERLRPGSGGGAGRRSPSVRDTVTVPASDCTGTGARSPVNSLTLMGVRDPQFPARGVTLRLEFLAKDGTNPILGQSLKALEEPCSYFFDRGVRRR
jgi:hypothetical protein